MSWRINTYNQKEWKQAKNYYEQAIQFKSTQYTQDKIKGINWKLKQIYDAKKKSDEIAYDTIYYDDNTISLIPRGDRYRYRSGYIVPSDTNPPIILKYEPMILPDSLNN